jgi:hypothetical protein
LCKELWGSTAIVAAILEQLQRNNVLSSDESDGEYQRVLCLLLQAFPHSQASTSSRIVMNSTPTASSTTPSSSRRSSTSFLNLSGRAGQDLKAEHAVKSSICEGIKNALLQLPTTSSLRASIVALMVQNANIPLSRMTEFLGVNERSLQYARHRAQEDIQPLLDIHRWDHVNAKTSPLAAACADAVDFWRSACRQTQARDENDERKDIWYYDITHKQVFAQYKATRVLQNYLALGSEEQPSTEQIDEAFMLLHAQKQVV